MNTVQKRDYTEYAFKGKQYGKGRLVLAVVQDYLKKHPKLTVRDIKTLFNSQLDIVESRHKADSKKFFVNEDDSLHAIGGNIVVTNQWTARNILPFISFAKNKLKLQIQVKNVHDLQVS